MNKQKEQTLKELFTIELQPKEYETLQDERILKTMIYSTSTKEPLYYCEIIDNTDCKEQYGMYVIQQGKESEWYYSTNAGRLEISSILNFKRLLLVSVDYHRSISSIDDIYYELQNVSQLFHFKGITFKKPDQNIEILTDQNGIGTRKLLFEKESKYNGTVWVEETWNDADDGSYFRRMLFSGERSLVQSEATIINDSIDIIRSTKTVNYYQGAVNCMKVFWNTESEKKICILGGGVNIMANAIKYNFRKSSVTSVELDPIVYES